MKPIYLDLHIHTSNDPNNLSIDYDLDTLIAKVKEQAQGDDFLISLTDHNNINERVYLEAVSKLDDKIILGVELHIKAYEDKDAKSYHCHIYFDLNKINAKVIQDLNKKLNILYPNKQPNKKDESIPIIESILNTFDEYSFVLLPHGGQSHATFDSAIPKGSGKKFDTLMERSIYYNFLDGFTSRSNVGTEETISYLKKLGVSDFVNLVTCTDNYDPLTYPSPKAKDASEFIPTWMYATANFSGLKLSLTDSARFEYSKKKPRAWKESVKSIKLDNENVEIDVNLTPGLNVVIGESSSGKTMLVDSLQRALSDKNFDDSKYAKEYGVEKLDIDFPDATVPHFISQNFISEIISEDKDINKIEIIEQIFPKNTEAARAINVTLEELKKDLEVLFESVESIEKIEKSLKTIPTLSNLISTNQINENVLTSFLSAMQDLTGTLYVEVDKKTHTDSLTEIEKRLEDSPFVNHDRSLVEGLRKEIEQVRSHSALEEKIREVVVKSKISIDKSLREKKGEEEGRRQDFDKLVTLIKKYYHKLNKFNTTLKKITAYSTESESQKRTIQGHTLSVKNEFELTKDIFQKELNELLLRDHRISDINNLAPVDLFRDKFNNNKDGSSRAGNPTYKYIKENIHLKFSKSNKVSYKIETSKGKDFEKLSPGLKTAVILELIINFEEDNAPLIIDQPEDNLATSYINGDLVESIKKNKRKKQIIFVSHNATIPMSGDAQNIILCENDGNKITIKSSPLEGRINDKDIVDYVAKITDGGKSSVKKRFKKYNLKQFKD